MGFDFTCGLKTTSKRLATRYKLVCLVLSQHNFTGLMRPERSKQYCLQLYIYIYIYIYTRDSADNLLLTVLNDLKIRAKLSN